MVTALQEVVALGCPGAVVDVELFNFGHVGSSIETSNSEHSATKSHLQVVNVIKTIRFRRIWKLTTSSLENLNLTINPGVAA